MATGNGLKIAVEKVELYDLLNSFLLKQKLFRKALNIIVLINELKF
jgi:hypothetical protein